MNLEEIDRSQTDFYEGKGAPNREKLENPAFLFA
jgi:hypothetical protein